MRAEAYEAMGELFKAISDIRPTAKLIPDNQQAYLRMSLLHYRMGEEEDSLKWVQISPNQCYALCLFAFYFILLSVFSFFSFSLLFFVLLYLLKKKQHKKEKKFWCSIKFEK